MVTPFDEQGEINYSSAAALARYLVEHGSTGLVISGTTGESPTLTEEEKLKLFRVVVEAVGEKAAVIAGTGSNSTAAAAKLTGKAASTGVRGVLLVTPYYNKPTPEERSVPGSTDLPVMLYNVPGRTGVNMDVETVLRLAEIDNIIALKEAGGSRSRRGDPAQAPGFSLYSGDALTLPLLSLGAVGVVSVAAPGGSELQR